MILNADLCHALATMSRLDMELAIHNCGLADDAVGAFVECLHSDRGPIELSCCHIDIQIIASALPGNSRAARLELSSIHRNTNDADMVIFFAALASNKGLVDLDLFAWSISNDNWSILCEYLKVHPTLTNLGLWNTNPLYESRWTKGLQEVCCNRTVFLLKLNARHRSTSIQGSTTLQIDSTTRWHSTVDIRHSTHDD
jgi:hypothetical protein